MGLSKFALIIMRFIAFLFFFTLQTKIQGEKNTEKRM